MRKIFGLLTGLALVFGFAACDDGYEYEAHVSTLKIVKSEVSFQNIASTGYVEVESPTTISAKVSDAWLTATVNGNRVNVTVPHYNDIDSRNATLTIYNSTDTVTVPVHQSGSLFSVPVDDTYLLDPTDAAVEVSTEKITVDYNITTSADWIKVVKKANSITLALDDNKGTYRKGSVTFESVNGAQKTVLLCQLGASFAGTYSAIWSQLDSNGNTVKYKLPQMTIEDAGNNVFNIADLVEEGPIPLTYDPSTHTFDLPNGTRIGEWSPAEGTTYYLYAIINYTNSAGNNYISWNTASANYHVYFKAEIDSEGNLYINWYDSQKFSPTYYTQLGFLIQALKADKFASANSLGYVYMFRGLTMELLDE
jgi:hypothetical protein